MNWHGRVFGSGLGFLFRFGLVITLGVVMVVIDWNSLFYGSRITTAYDQNLAEFGAVVPAYWCVARVGCPRFRFISTLKAPR